MIAAALKESEASIKALLTSEAWEGLEGEEGLVDKSKNAPELAGALLTADFWRKLDWLIDLNEPVVESMHGLEADQPLLSKVLPAWKGLVGHARKWGVGKPQPIAKQVLDLFQARYKKHCRPNMVAAFAVDPDNFSYEMVAGMATVLPPTLSDEEREQVVKVVVRMSGGSAWAVEEELVGMESAIWPPSMVTAVKVVLVGAEGQPKPDVPMQRRRALWLRCKDMYPLFSGVAFRLLSLHPSSCAAERNWSAWGRTYTSLRNRLSKEKAEQMIFFKANLPKTAEEL